MAHASDEIDYRTVLLRVGEKLRGSRARRLGDDLDTLRIEGYDQVVLDLTACASLDSVGALSIRTALERGQRLFVVIEPGVTTEDFLPPELWDDERLRVFADHAEALRCVRSREQSGVVLV